MNKLIISFALLFLQLASNAQNVGIGTSSPDSSALLELSSNNKGFLPPRMTTNEKNAIAHPANGLVIFNTTTNCLEMYVYNKWQNVFCGVADSTTNVDSTLLTDIDGNTYPTVKICNQTWMAKNLDVARYRNGDIIPKVTDPTEWANLTTGAWCWYNNDSANGAIYGRLYNWYAVNDPRGLAPEGWHVPIIGEWQELIQCLGGEIDAGGKMKSIGNSLWESPNIGATNSSGFNGLPGGGIWPSSTFINLNKYGIWWSSGYNNNIRGWGLDLFNNSKAIGLFTDNFDYTFGFSVRCVKDTPITTLNNGLVAYYPFNGNANDESGNGNNGIVNGATLTTDRFGNSGKAYSFDGVSNYIKCLQPGPIGNPTISVSFWIKSGQSNYGHIIGYGSDGQNGKDFRIYISPDCGTGDITFDTYGSANSFTDNHFIDNWDNYIVIYNGTFGANITSSKIYKNGILLTNNCRLINRASTNIESIIPITFGKYHGTVQDGYFNGFLDDIRIYNRALTQEEITYLATH